MNKWNPRGKGDNRGAPSLKPAAPRGAAQKETGPSVANIVHLELRRYISSRFEGMKDGFLAINTTRSGICPLLR